MQAVDHPESDNSYLPQESVRLGRPSLFNKDIEFEEIYKFSASQESPRFDDPVPQPMHVVDITSAGDMEMGPPPMPPPVLKILIVVSIQLQVAIDVIMIAVAIVVACM